MLATVLEALSKQLRNFVLRVIFLEGFSTKGGVERDGIYFVMEGEKEKQARDEDKRSGWKKSN